MKTENFNKKIKILVIGKDTFTKSLKECFLLKLSSHYELEIINDEKAALKRLNHNSYDVLLLEDEFSKYNTIRLSMMAYAMSRPTIVICKSIIKKLYYSICWKYFSKYSRRFKTTRKLIFFSINNSKHSELIYYLATNHLQYFKIINSEISKSTNL